MVYRERRPSADSIRFLQAATLRTQIRPMGVKTGQYLSPIRTATEGPCLNSAPICCRSLVGQRPPKANEPGTSGSPRRADVLHETTDRQLWVRKPTLELKVPRMTLIGDLIVWANIPLSRARAASGVRHRPSAEARIASDSHGLGAAVCSELSQDN